MSDKKMYDILGKFNNLDPKMTPVKEDVKAEPVYENVEPRGSIMEAVASLHEKYMGFKKTVAAIKKGGSAENPEAVAAAIGRKKYGKKKFQKAAAAGKKLGEAAKPDFLDVDGDGNKKETFKKAVKDKKQVEESGGPYELYNPKHPKFAANYKKFKAKNPDCKLEDFIAAMKKKEHGVNEGEYDPAPIDPEAVAKRKRLQAIKDRQEAERAEKGDDHKSNVRTVKGKAYGGAAQKDDADDELNEYSQAEYDQAMADFKAKGGRATQLPPGSAKNPISTASRHIAGRGEAGKGKPAGRGAKTDATGKPVVDVYEKAPPGAKAERMVKHIKKGYAKDGKLTKREKGIAYATAWKAHNKGQLQESRMIQEGDYFYEKLGKALAEKNPTLNTADSSFVTAVRQEMVAQGIEPNRARNIIMIDDDFIGDVATSYGHYCREIAECGAPVNSFVGGAEELDEFAPLAAAAGADLAAAAPAIATVSAAKELDEIAQLAGLKTEMDSKVPSDSSSPLTHGLHEESDEAKLERYHELIRRGMDPDDAEVMVFNDEDDEEVDETAGFKPSPEQLAAKDKIHARLAKTPAAPPVSEEEMGEGNEFSGALAAAKASGKKEFEVGGKKYTVKEDVTLMADGDDVVNLIRKLSGLDTQEIVAPAAPVRPIVGTIPSDEEAEEIAAQLQGEPAIEEERDVEYTNTPREEVAGLDASIPAGADLNRAKKQFKKEYPGDNPMAVKEEALWKAYESMISDVKK